MKLHELEETYKERCQIVEDEILPALHKVNKRVCSLYGEHDHYITRVVSS